MQLSASTQATSTTPVTGSTPFVLRRSRYLPTLNITVEEYEHLRTGAVHFHLASDNPENVFLVALRTVPMDSTGVAHILEHTALCGSRRFPVRDPFFMMIRRSMNTFMNAFTSSDWTAYPFASQNRKDFNNLLEVYLDAVFFSNLDELDFAQEGHRLEFSEPENPDSPLEYKGVVYNEMKGAMSSPNSWIWQELSHHLFPTTTYHYNSGGDPAHIPELSYEQLRSFYRSHYHPSNAIFMTFGNIPAAEHQGRFEALALKEFERLDIHVAVGDEVRYREPKRVTTHYPVDANDEEGGRTHVLLAWLLGKSSNLEELYKAQLLSSVLLDNSASPLLHALETTGLGRAPSPLCGLEDSCREMSLICGLEGCAEDATDAVEQLVLDTLRQVEREGVPQEMVEAALHTLELHQREISGDSYPYGLQLILSALSTATHRGDPIELLDIDPVLERLSREIQDRDFIPRLIRDYLLDNPHRLTLTVLPDTGLAARREAEEAERLASIKASLSEEQREEIVQRALALQERQNRKPDASLLPKVELSDVPADISWPKGTTTALDLPAGKLPLTRYAQGTNGLSYQQVILELPALSTAEASLLPWHATALTELGVGQRSYLDIQSLQASVSGGLNAYPSLRSRLGDEQDVMGYYVLSSKALYRKQQDLAQLMAETLHECRFDELERLRELVDQVLSRREQSITSQGHGLAMGAASARLSPLAWHGYNSAGLEGIRQLKALAQSLRARDALAAFAASLHALHGKLLQGSARMLVVAEEAELDVLGDAIRRTWETRPLSSGTGTRFALPRTRERSAEAWLTNSQVNFCAMAFPTVPAGHADAAALSVLAGFLRNGFLHRAIREQGGAYGGGATQDAGSASFRFYSYRDPRLEETLDDYRRSIDWMLKGGHEYAQLEEAILGVISSLDKPASPAGAAKQAFHNELFGRTREERAAFRKRVLEVSLEELRQVTERYLCIDDPGIAIVSDRSKQARLERMGLEIYSL